MKNLIIILCVLLLSISCKKDKDKFTNIKKELTYWGKFENEGGLYGTNMDIICKANLADHYIF